MLSENQIKEIRAHLDKAQSPLFFFDNDSDGLSSFLLLRRAINRGKGIAIKSFPDLNKNYSRKLYELAPDYVFVLDKPLISRDFLDEIKVFGIPLVWIDHHNVPKPEDKEIFYYNSYNSETINEPVSYLCYKAAGKKEDIWLAMLGCIGDSFLPDFTEEFIKEYNELWGSNIKTAFQALYTTEVGKISRILNFALKDKTSKVVSMIKFLSNIKSPYEIFDEEKAKTILQRYRQINNKYMKLIEKAKKLARGRILFFQYGGELSISADISNELFFMYPEKIIVVAYVKGSKANVSLRWKEDIRTITLKAIEGLEGATGGGHEHATGAQVSVEDLPRFKENLMRLLD